MTTNIKDESKERLDRLAKLQYKIWRVPTTISGHGGKVCHKVGRTLGPNISDIAAHSIIKRESANTSHPYWAGLHQRQLEGIKVDNLLTDKVAGLVKTEWASPIVMRPRKRDSALIVLLSRLSKILVRNSYFIPQMYECIDILVPS